MMQRYDTETADRIMAAYGDDYLYRLFSPILSQLHDLTPAEYWGEALQALERLKAFSTHQALAVDQLQGELIRRYGRYSDSQQERSPSEACNTAMAVMTVVLYMLMAEGKDHTQNPYREYAGALIVHLRGNAVAKRLMEAFRKCEEALDRQGKEIAPHDYMADTAAATTTADDGALVERLLPVFKGDEAMARLFLSMARSAKPTAVMALVNGWVKDGRIVKEMSGTQLWRILHDGGLYAPSVQNWNKQLK